jgi:hypothetical protein
MQLWTYEHVISILPVQAVLVWIAFLLRRWLGKRVMRIRMIPFQIVSVLLLLLEVGKQIISLAHGYDLYHLPFHFCSLFIFMLPLMAFYSGKYSNHVKNITASLCASVVILMLIYPNLIYSTNDVHTFLQDYFAFHTVSFHNLVLFAFTLILSLELWENDARKYNKAIACFTIGFCIISATMAQLLQTNFNNFYSCNVPPLEDVRLYMQQLLGYGFTQVCYILIVTLLDIGFVQLSYLLFRVLRAWFCLHRDNKKLAVN